MYTYVETKTEQKKATEVCFCIMEQIARKLRSKYKMKVSILPIGSQKVNLITKNEQGVFDLDYNLLLGHLPEVFLNNPKRLKDVIRGWCDMIINREYTNCGKDSTSSLKYIFRKKDGSMTFTMDIGIIASVKNRKPLRLIYDKPSNAYIWNEMTMKYDIMNKNINLLRKEGKANELRDIYLAKKNDSKYRDRKSAQILLETVNELMRK